jgi:hypothetical protein
MVNRPKSGNSRRPEAAFKFAEIPFTNVHGNLGSPAQRCFPMVSKRVSEVDPDFWTAQ